MMWLLLYLRIGVLLSAFNLGANVLAGATLLAALRAEARKTKAPRWHWLALVGYIVVLWPVNLAYTISVVLGLQPRKSWQELNDEQE